METELNGGNGYTTLWNYLLLLNFQFKMVNFYTIKIGENKRNTCWISTISAIMAFFSHPDHLCLLFQLNGSVGVNIFSAICSAVGIVLFITDISIISTHKLPNYYVPFETRGVVSIPLNKRSYRSWQLCLEKSPERVQQASILTKHCGESWCYQNHSQPQIVDL